MSKVFSKNGVEFCQRSIGAIRCGLATSYDDVKPHATLLYFSQSEVFSGWWWVVKIHADFSKYVK